MPYGRRHYRRRTGRARSVGRNRRRSYGRQTMYRKKRRARSAPMRRRRRTYKKRSFSKKRRRSAKRGHFKTIPKSIKRAGTLACLVVYECLKKLGDTNTCWNIKDCNGNVRSTVDKFASESPFLKFQGPYRGTSESGAMPCGQLGFPIFSDVSNAPTDLSGAQSTNQNPGDILYKNTPFSDHVFPLLARTNPTVTSALMNAQNCRLGDKCNIIFFDNKHSLRIDWGAIDTTAAIVQNIAWDQRLMLHEVVYWIPDIKTVIDNGLVNDQGSVDTVAEAQVQLRLARSWSRRMYNAYFVAHPVLDDGTTSLLDVVDITTGGLTEAFDCWNEPLHVTQANRDLQITDDNMLPRFRDTKEYLAAGVLDRRKDARPVWNKKRKFRRPRYGAGRYGVAVHEAGAGSCVLPQQHTYVTAGRRFNINKNMQWEKTEADSNPDSTVREVCPRGCYYYRQYWYFSTNSTVASTSVASTSGLPIISISHTRRVDKTMIVKFQNL